MYFYILQNLAREVMIMVIQSVNEPPRNRLYRYDWYNNTLSNPRVTA